ncbi:MAG TPA: hypothetical protein ENJ35_02440 [Gammaproteobacteria bacterium]|nr:hypothetical protein [Gammaproteobacteria bacterium]
MNERIHAPNLTQNIQSAGQVAGNTIINEYNGLYNPDPNHPNLIECPGCGQPVYREADRHWCGYNFEKARKKQEEQMQAQALIALFSVGLAVVFVFSLSAKLDEIIDIGLGRCVALVVASIAISAYASRRMIERVVSFLTGE